MTTVDLYIRTAAVLNKTVLCLSQDLIDSYREFFQNAYYYYYTLGFCTVLSIFMENK